MKTCSVCGVSKDEVEFSTRASSGKPRANCRKCGVEKAVEWAKKNRLRCREASCRFRKAHIEKVREEARLRARKRRSDLKTLTGSQSSETIRRAQRAYISQRRRKDPAFRITLSLRGKLTKALKRDEARKSYRTLELLGCPLIWLEIHLSSLFRPGMTWENHGSVWHIDHIRPCASFDLTKPEEQRSCFHWTNLQPLFVLENLQKSDTYVTTGQPPKEIGSRCCQAASRR